MTDQKREEIPQTNVEIPPLSSLGTSSTIPSQFSNEELSDKSNLKHNTKFRGVVIEGIDKESGKVISRKSIGEWETTNEAAHKTVSKSKPIEGDVRKHKITMDAFKQFFIYAFDKLLNLFKGQN